MIGRGRRKVRLGKLPSWGCTTDSARGYGVNFDCDRASSPPLPSLLSRVLLAFAIELEGKSEVSLAISANVLRLVGVKGIHVRDLPCLAGMSREAIAMSVTFLEKRGYAVMKPESPGSRAKVFVLTPKGRDGRNSCIQFDPTAQPSALFRGMELYHDGWRSSVCRPEGLPHPQWSCIAVVFPDGS